VNRYGGCARCNGHEDVHAVGDAELAPRIGYTAKFPASPTILPGVVWEPDLSGGNEPIANKW
jgi:hypothetical protein